MRYSAEHKGLTREKILDAAARRFRAEGYDGLGIDGLAKAAGVTNGAFYGHFASKADAFREIAVLGLVDLREGIERFQTEHGDGWLEAFTRFYFSESKLDFLENACALPSFAPEMTRAPRETRDAFEAALGSVAQAIADGLPGADAASRKEKAWAILGILAGGVMLARSVSDAVTREAIIAGLTATVAARAVMP